MKSIRSLGVALLLAVALLPLREWTDLDLLRAPVNRWLWLRSEIVGRPAHRIDYAFTGSSMMLSAIRPERIAERYPGTVAYNFAHFSWGHDADYFIARPLLERHDVGTLVVELPRVAPRDPHGETVHLVGAREIVGEAGIALADLAAGEPFERVVSRFFRYAETTLLSFPRHVLERVLAVLGGSGWEYRGSAGAWEQHNGFAITLDGREPDAAFRDRQRRRPATTPTSPGRPTLGGAPEPAPGARDDWYLARLRDLAHEHGTRLVFLHLPRWQKRLPSRARYDYYRQFGEVLIPDVGKLTKPDHYVDPLHLYREGTEILTDDVARLIVEGTAGSPFDDLYRDPAPADAEPPPR